jgi:hypothetical protein
MYIERAVSDTQSFSGLLPIAEQAEARLSFWGYQYVYVNGYEGTLHIDALASRVLELLREVDYEFSEAERESGKQLAEKIDRLYVDTDRQFSEANCFTQAMTVLREIISRIFNYCILGNQPIRIMWHDDYLFNPNRNITFKFYTRTQFQDAFQMSPEKAEQNGYHLNSSYSGGNLRWAPPEELLQSVRRTAAESI